MTEDAVLCLFVRIVFGCFQIRLYDSDDGRIRRKDLLCVVRETVCCGSFRGVYTRAQSNKQK